MSETTVICDDCGSPPILVDSDSCSGEHIDIICDCEDNKIHLATDFEDFPNGWSK